MQALRAQQTLSHSTLAADATFVDTVALGATHLLPRNAPGVLRPLFDDNMQGLCCKCEANTRMPSLSLQRYDNTVVVGLDSDALSASPTKIIHCRLFPTIHKFYTQRGEGSELMQELAHESRVLMDSVKASHVIPIS